MHDEKQTLGKDNAERDQDEGNINHGTIGGEGLDISSDDTQEKKSETERTGNNSAVTTENTGSSKTPNPDSDADAESGHS